MGTLQFGKNSTLLEGCGKNCRGYVVIGNFGPKSLLQGRPPSTPGGTLPEGVGQMKLDLTKRHLELI